jgi:hypothetical protein
MSGTAAGFLQRCERGGLGLSRAERAGHEADRWLVGSRIEVAADDGEVGVGSGSDPFSKLSYLLLPCSIFHLGGDEMSDVHVKEPSVDLKTSREGDAVMGAIVETCRLGNRVTREQPLGLNR